MSGHFFATTNSSVARWLRRRRARHVSPDAPVILGGCPRSGTTLLRVMLDTHSRIACGPESSLFAGSFLPGKLAARFDIATQEVWQLRHLATDHAHFIELFYQRYLEGRRKARWADKTPQNIRHLPWILQHFPRARFLHVIRDGRDVVCSMRTHPRFRLVNGQRLPTGIRRPIRPCLQQWLGDTAAGLPWRGHPQYHEVRYEDLVERPEPTLRSVCDFLGEPFEQAMLAYHEETGPSRDPDRFAANEAATQPLSADAVARWRRDLTEAELSILLKRAGPRLAELGYGAHAAEGRA